jgi:hypothetical protein
VGIVISVQIAPPIQPLYSRPPLPAQPRRTKHLWQTAMKRKMNSDLAPFASCNPVRLQRAAWVRQTR